ncbi:MAG: hypothetical protein HJJLKODD_02197 [Phycisphaerae bacterium]|nr:hypothetical protein [Phycisphaerae bacterium]
MKRLFLPYLLLFNLICTVGCSDNRGDVTVIPLDYKSMQRESLLLDTFTAYWSFWWTDKAGNLNITIEGRQGFIFSDDFHLYIRIANSSFSEEGWLENVPVKAIGKLHTDFIFPNTTFYITRQGVATIYKNENRLEGQFRLLCRKYDPSFMPDAKYFLYWNPFFMAKDLYHDSMHQKEDVNTDSILGLSQLQGTFIASPDCCGWGQKLKQTLPDLIVDN